MGARVHDDAPGKPRARRRRCAASPACCLRRALCFPQPGSAPSHTQTRAGTSKCGRYRPAPWHTHAGGTYHAKDGVRAAAPFVCVGAADVAVFCIGDDSRACADPSSGGQPPADPGSRAPGWLTFAGGHQPCDVVRTGHNLFAEIAHKDFVLLVRTRVHGMRTRVVCPLGELRARASAGLPDGLDAPEHSRGS